MHTCFKNIHSFIVNVQLARNTRISFHDSKCRQFCANSLMAPGVGCSLCQVAAWGEPAAWDLYTRSRDYHASCYQGTWKVTPQKKRFLVETMIFVKSHVRLWEGSVAKAQFFGIQLHAVGLEMMACYCTCYPFIYWVLILITYLDLFGYIHPAIIFCRLYLPTLDMVIARLFVSALSLVWLLGILEMDRRDVCLEILQTYQTTTPLPHRTNCLRSKSSTFRTWTGRWML